MNNLAMNNSESVLDYVYKDFCANEWIDKAKEKKTPQQLFGTLWHEGEVCCLFADTNAGKSILAVQIGNEIATVLEKTVLYFDYELSDKQFQMRYCDEATGEKAYFSPLFRRLECEPGMLPDNLDDILDSISRAVQRRGATVVIIDNLTWLCNACENGEAAGYFMRRLLEMKRETGISVLVVSHTPKREPGMPLDQNSLAGSKRLANFFDSIFAIGVDCNEPKAGRYVKQIKVRSAALEYHEGNVLRYDIVRDHNMLCFRQCDGHFTESQFLSAQKSDRPFDEMKRKEAERREERNRMIMLMHASGMKQRDIAEKASVSLYTVNTVINKYLESKEFF